MVAGQMMFDVVVTKVVCSWAPVDDELAFMDVVLDPVKAHIHSLTCWVWFVWVLQLQMAESIEMASWPLMNKLAIEPQRQRA